MRPLIGMTLGTAEDEKKGRLDRQYHDYGEAVAEAGGAPFWIPPLADKEALDTLLLVMDGLLLTGGGDLEAWRFGEDPHPALSGVQPWRDEAELYLYRRAREMNLPILGICRGCQLINVAQGGSLVQDIPSQLPGSLAHQQSLPADQASHGIRVEERSRLGHILGLEEVEVNSFHHQAVGRLGEGLRLAASSAGDGVVEGIEGTAGPFLLGVQWHPERMEKRA
ncbi:MAG: gamma-glutamyl-gamma-aminobutyrate hydrolase family protein, partial [Bacillota bacterium]|nr:gamma-glutamyl-gamma-aminobutyrate hydrolase family protein [Bacillota bacterium]